MGITAVGSIAFDSVATPVGVRDRHARRCSNALRPRCVALRRGSRRGVVGDDFGEGEFELLQTRGTNVDDVARVPGGRTFFWRGEYGWDLNSRESLDTQLNVFEHFAPELSRVSCECDVLFLANIQPGLQLEVRRQCPGARFVALDSMNLWIDVARDQLVEVMRASTAYF